MPMEKSDWSQPLPQPKLELYAQLRLVGVPSQEAFFQAGWTNKSRSGPPKIEYRKDVKARLKWLQSQSAQVVITSNAVTRNEIVQSLRDTRQKAKEAVEGAKPDLSAANRADEILAKMHGFMLDVTRKETLDDELDGKDPEELKAFVLSLLEQLDPNLKKLIVSEIATEETSDGQTIQ